MFGWRDLRGFRDLIKTWGTTVQPMEHRFFLTRATGCVPRITDHLKDSKLNRSTLSSKCCSADGKNELYT